MNTLRKLEYPTSLGQRSRSENEYPCLARLGSNRGIHFYQNLRDFTYRADVTDFSYIRFFITLYGAGHAGSVSTSSKESSSALYPSENSSFRLPGGSQETYSMAMPSRMSAV